MNTQIFIEQILSGTIWSPHFSLDRNQRLTFNGKRFVDALPQSAGLYCISIEGVPVRAYVGQSGNLRTRIQQLQGAYGVEMPFKDPHVAGPGLWAWHHIEPRRELGVSFAVIDCSAYLRQGLEDFVIAHERWMHAYGVPLEERWQGQHSPLLNFGQMPPHYRPSSFRAKGYRGRPTHLELECHFPGIAPVCNLLGEKRHPLDERWGNHAWTPWCYARDFMGANGEQGLYRLCEGSRELFFIGHGRLGEAARKAARSSPTLLFSAVAGPWTHQQQLELLSDSLGLYLIATNALPRAQYGGEGSKYSGGEFPPLPRVFLTWSGRIKGVLEAARSRITPELAAVA